MTGPEGLLHHCQVPLGSNKNTLLVILLVCTLPLIVGQLLSSYTGCAGLGCGPPTPMEFLEYCEREILALEQMDDCGEIKERIQELKQEVKEKARLINEHHREQVGSMSRQERLERTRQLKKMGTAINRYVWQVDRTIKRKCPGM